MRTRKQIKQMLHELAKLQTECERVEERKERALKRILTPELKGLIAHEGSLKDEIISQRQGIKDAVLEYRDSISTKHLMAVYCEGKTTFFTRTLKAFLAHHNVLSEYSKEGEPYVAIRKKGKGYWGGKKEKKS